MIPRPSSPSLALTAPPLPATPMFQYVLPTIMQSLQAAHIKISARASVWPVRLATAMGAITFPENTLPAH